MSGLKTIESKKGRGVEGEQGGAGRALQGGGSAMIFILNFITFQPDTKITQGGFYGSMFQGQQERVSGI